MRVSPIFTVRVAPNKGYLLPYDKSVHIFPPNLKPIKSIALHLLNSALHLVMRAGVQCAPGALRGQGLFNIHTLFIIHSRFYLFPPYHMAAALDLISPVCYHGDAVAGAVNKFRVCYIDWDTQHEDATLLRSYDFLLVFGMWCGGVCVFHVALHVFFLV